MNRGFLPVVRALLEGSRRGPNLQSNRGNGVEDGFLLNPAVTAGHGGEKVPNIGKVKRPRILEFHNSEGFQKHGHKIEGGETPVESVGVEHKSIKRVRDGDCVSGRFEMDGKEREIDFAGKMAEVVSIDHVISGGRVFVEMNGQHHGVAQRRRGSVRTLQAASDGEEKRNRRRDHVGTFRERCLGFGVHRAVEVELRGENDGGLIIRIDELE